jgi:prepilin-type processing-associated H-X9-DG protein
MAGGNPPGNLPNVIKNYRGWVNVLPFIDRADLFKRFDPNQAAGNYDRAGGPTGLTGNATNGNDVIVSELVDAFICPSDPGNSRIRGSGTVNDAYSPSWNANAALRKQGAKTNYDFQSPLYTSNCPNWTTSGSGKHMFGVESSCRMKDITDGTSVTVMLCETTLDVKDGLTAPWGYSNWTGIGVDLSSVPGWNFGSKTVAPYAQGCAAIAAPDGTTAAPRAVNYKRCCSWSATKCANDTPNSVAHWGRAGSSHAGGCHVAMADGGVRFLNQNIYATNTVYGEVTLTQRLVRIADGNPVGEF